MEIFGIAVCVICTALLGAVVKKSNKEYALLMTLAAATVFLLLILQKVQPLLQELGGLWSSEFFQGEIFAVMLKAVGITLVAQTATSVCKDAGEATLSFIVELSAKVAILLSSMPLILQILDYLAEIINM